MSAAVGIALAERGLVPNPVLRWGVRRLLRRRIRDEETGGADRAHRFVEAMRTGPVAPVPDAANAQHYEVPSGFFEQVLGPRLKYSSCLFEEGVSDLAEAEEAMLARTCERAGIRDGQEILELGCGWGSLSLWLADRYPHARILAVSNSSGQRAFIEARRDRLGLRNLEVWTRDMNAFEPARTFDRVVSVEMFEHMRNYALLLERIAGWLRPDGRLFVHVFCHDRYAYPFEAEGADNWMGRHFFTGGLMPSHDLLRRFDADLVVERQWRVDGTHYQRTAEAWLCNLRARRAEVLELFARARGRPEARRIYHRWKLFFLACAELFGYRGGSEWFVSHNLLSRKS